ncbi:SDR family oxidoreductase [Jannaschia aquimarina]|uniref:XecD protein n=1 Tax=Jannaschia aquimarina TaxID=935700 RepID=A0A0D1EPD5_9RHOB|nr:SDR family oxidoreductase [Jannaschia aquimarina]KIT17530.1 2-(R)-hydroxypropyl-CoM dehydrogenase [Jannaschia aquimarina]SNS73611.1 Short-chain dehydrogenase [Jannaschia aquimarina]
MTRIAVVAGGSAGVGRAVVSAMIDRGWKVAVLARGKERLDEIASEYGDAVFTRTCNVAEDAQLQAAADAIMGHWGAPDVWVNCAMLTKFAAFEDVTEDEFQKITATTYFGQVNGCRAALRIMKRGNIVNVGSGLSYRPVPLQAAYVGAKHAINGFTGALRSELIHQGRPIELSLVQLPAINTPQFDWARNAMAAKPQPAPPIFQPQVAADAVMKAIDTNARELLVGRSVIELVFGDMLLPGMIDKQMATSGYEAQASDQKDWGRPDNLEGPIDYPPRAEGSYGHRAEPSGLIVDADMARKAAVFGGVAIAFGLGAAIGGFLGGRGRPASPNGVAMQDNRRPWGYDRPPAGSSVRALPH